MGRTAERTAAPLPAAWALPPGELLKAGHKVARDAAWKWEEGNAEPTSKPLPGIADSPVLTFLPQKRGLLKTQPARWRYEDKGRYAGKAAIEIAQTDFRPRKPRNHEPDWHAAAEVLSRVLATGADPRAHEPVRAQQQEAEPKKKVAAKTTQTTTSRKTERGGLGD